MRPHPADEVLTPQFSKSDLPTTASPFDRQPPDQGKHSCSFDGSVVLWLWDSFLEAQQPRVCFFSPQNSSVEY